MGADIQDVTLPIRCPANVQSMAGPLFYIGIGNLPAHVHRFAIHIIAVVRRANHLPRTRFQRLIVTAFHCDWGLCHLGLGVECGRVL